MRQLQIELNSLEQLTCIIPFRDDSRQRRKNLSAVVGYLTELGCSVIVSESGPRQHAPQIIKAGSLKCRFYFHPEFATLFHRTRAINQAAHRANTELIALWDTDVVIPYVQMAWSVGQLLERKCDYSFPSDGRCVDFAGHASVGNLSSTMRKVAFSSSLPLVDEDGDGVITVLTGGTELVGHMVTRTCVGGAVLFRREVFIKGGMENEAFISYGPEDQEREARFRKLGFVSCRSQGLLYHLAHPRGINSDDGHTFSDSNWTEFRRIKKLSPSRLTAEISEWGWTNPSTPDM